MKKDVSKKLALNKKTIVRLNLSEMKKSLAGARASRIGVSCYTGKCCYSKKVCDSE